MHDPHFNILNVMTPFPHSVDLGASLLEARQFMKEHKIRHLPITKDGRIVRDGWEVGREGGWGTLRDDWEGSTKAISNPELFEDAWPGKVKDE